MPKLAFPFVSDSLKLPSFLSRSLFLPVRFSRRYPPRPPLLLSVRMDHHQTHRFRDNKVVVIMGATGSGKSRLSVDLATCFLAEVINSDKMQFYDGLRITTNQISVFDRRGVPHHLLGELDPDAGEVTAADFRSTAARAILRIVSRGKLPIIAGGSNSFVHALLSERFDPEADPFSSGFGGSICTDLRYDCCFLWIDVSFPVLFDYLSKRVDEMMDSGMFEELADFYDAENDPGEKGTRLGLWKAIGVPEFDRFFRMYPPENNKKKQNKKEWDSKKKAAYEKAVREVKESTYELAKKQIEKIVQLRRAGWDIKRLDATAAFREVVAVGGAKPEENGGGGGGRGGGGGGGRWREIWEEVVLEPSVKIVKRFLEE